jgi:hypothetical protein
VGDAPEPDPLLAPSSPDPPTEPVVVVVTGAPVVDVVAVPVELIGLPHGECAAVLREAPFLAARATYPPCVVGFGPHSGPQYRSVPATSTALVEPVPLPVVVVVVPVRLVVVVVPGPVETVVVGDPFDVTLVVDPTPRAAAAAPDATKTKPAAPRGSHLGRLGIVFSSRPLAPGTQLTRYIGPAAPRT